MFFAINVTSDILLSLMLTAHRTLTDSTRKLVIAAAAWLNARPLLDPFWVKLSSILSCTIHLPFYVRCPSLSVSTSSLAAVASISPSDKPEIIYYLWTNAPSLDMLSYPYLISNNLVPTFMRMRKNKNAGDFSKCACELENKSKCVCLQPNA